MNIKVLTFLFFIFVASANAQPFTSYDVFKAALDRTNYLLQPTGDGPVNMQSALNNSYYPDAVLVVSWVKMDELQVRKIRISKWLRTQKPKNWGFDSSELDTGLKVFNTGVAAYYLDALGSPLLEKPTGRIESGAWTRWLPPKNFQDLFKELMTDLPKALATQPIDEDSVCLIIQYAKNGELWERHYYVPNIDYVYAVLVQVQSGGLDYSQWSQRDDRLRSPQEWTVREHRFLPQPKNSDIDR
jgi:hypothetical protein